MKSKSDKLALLGGDPIRKSPWPVWPRADENTEKILKDVLYSGRWAISGCYTGKKSYERQFAEAFAEFNNVPYCVPTANGSAALKIALEALGVGYGKEVLVPGLTWVACASSVLATGAIPVLVDIDPNTLCMSLEKATEAITKNTAAIMLVHMYCMIADIEGFLKLSTQTGIPIIEDCSHVHGAIWKGQRVGTFGKIGVFSMQQSKVLTCGEGGAAITKDRDLYEKMQEFRADGRRYKEGPVKIGEMELEEIGSVQGRNYCMSEFHAAILLDRLQHLDEENKIRAQNAKYLNSLLLDSTDVIPFIPPPENVLPVYYEYCFRLNLAAFRNNTVDKIAKALTAELAISINPVYEPLNHNILQNSLLFLKIYKNKKNEKLFYPLSYEMPLSLAQKAKKECLTIPHNVLLESQNQMHDIVYSFFKIKNNL